MNINWFFISSLTLSITTFIIIAIILFYGHEKVHKIYALFNLTVLIWAVNATVASQIRHPFFSLLFFKIGSLGAHFISISMVHLSYVWTKNNNGKIILLSYLQGVLVAFLLLGTDLIFIKQFTTFYGSFWIPKAGILFVPWYLLWITTIIYAHYPLIKFYLIQTKQEKDGLKYFFAGSSIGFIMGSLNFLLPFDNILSQYSNFGISLYCIVTAFAFLKVQLLGIEIVIRKSIFYSIFIAILTGIYLMLIMLAEYSFRGIVGYKSTYVSIASAFIIAVLFNPLRDKIQEIIDRLFLGKIPQEIAMENEMLKQEIERSERLKTANTLALGLAHEIKNPLTTIKTFAEYLPEKYKDDEFVNKFSKLIPLEVERINNIVHQLLDFSKPAQPSFNETDIHNLLSNILEFLNSEFLKRKIKINETYEDSTMIIKIDPIQIKQALLNIILNAIEAMPNGGALTIKTGIEKDGFFEIQISDEGLGITEKNLKHIFDPFFSTKESGTGLGLSISHQIIKNHKGSIDVESELGKGTTFRIRLPMEL